MTFDPLHMGGSGEPPSFSQAQADAFCRELEDLAKVMMEAWHGTPVPFDLAYYSDRWLRVADAARTFFGSGYRLPEATEANAERLARAVRQVKILPADGLLWPAWTRESKDYLHALHAAFGEAEPKAATVAEDATVLQEKPVRDAVSRDEQREYEQLVRELTIRTAEHVINLAVEVADQYIEWRKMERNEAHIKKQV